MRLVPATARTARLSVTARAARARLPVARAGKGWPTYHTGECDTYAMEAMASGDSMDEEDNEEGEVEVLEQPEAAEAYTPPPPVQIRETNAAERLDPRQIVSRVNTAWTEVRLLNPGSGVPEPSLKEERGKTRLRFHAAPGCDAAALVAQVTAALGGDAARGENTTAPVLRVLTASASSPTQLNVAAADGVAVTVALPKGSASAWVEVARENELMRGDVDIALTLMRSAHLRSPSSPPSPPPQQQPSLTSAPETSTSVVISEPPVEEPPMEDLSVQEQLETLGASFLIEEAATEDSNAWGGLAGLEKEKLVLEETLLLALDHPDLFEGVARPRAVLLEGPPGTGKTAASRALAARAAGKMQLVYVNASTLEESDVAEVFALVNQIEGGCFLFLDQVDALSDDAAGPTSSLSHLIDGVSAAEKEAAGVVVIAATSRAHALDAALHSRFDTSVSFGLPDAATRRAVVTLHAAHLVEEEAEEVAAAAESLSSRDIVLACQNAQRRWIAQLIREGKKEKVAESLPTLDAYLDSVRARLQTVAPVGAVVPAAPKEKEPQKTATATQEPPQKTATPPEPHEQESTAATAKETPKEKEPQGTVATETATAIATQEPPQKTATPPEPHEQESTAATAKETPKEKEPQGTVATETATAIATQEPPQKTATPPEPHEQESTAATEAAAATPKETPKEPQQKRQQTPPQKARGTKRGFKKRR